MSRLDHDTFFSVRAIRNHRKRMSDMDKDASRKQRGVEGTCHLCFYLRGGGIVGQGFTEYTCRSCDETFMHPNTGTPKLCSRCATHQGRCSKCMALLAEVEAEVEAPKEG
jgi:hypothetical protein